MERGALRKHTCLTWCLHVISSHVMCQWLESITLWLFCYGQRSLCVFLIFLVPERSAWEFLPWSKGKTLLWRGPTWSANGGHMIKVTWPPHDCHMISNTWCTYSVKNLPYTKSFMGCIFYSDNFLCNNQ